MKKQTNKAFKRLSGVALIAALSQGASASELKSPSDNEGTYWGIGIGSVLGAVIAGPPGAAIGATLGGTYGWGQDKDDALETSLKDLEEASKALKSSEMALHQNRSALNKERKKVSELTRSNSDKSIQLSNLMAQKSHEFTGEDQTLLENITAHYQQEVFFKKGDKTVPDYAQDRLVQLSDFLKQHPNLEISLKGFADHRGPAAFNQQLAKSRAESVRNILVDQGIDAKRIDVHSLGESNTQAQPGDSGNYILDRRVAIELSVVHDASETIATTPPHDAPTPTENPEIAAKNGLIDTVLAEASK